MLNFVKKIAAKATSKTPAVSTAEPAPPSAEDPGALVSGEGDDDVPDWITEPSDPPAPSDPAFVEALADLDDDDRELLLERAAVAEYDGGLSRVEAERQALTGWQATHSKSESRAAEDPGTLVDPWAVVAVALARNLHLADFLTKERIENG